MQIFVGGYATSGSRVPSMILERAGYYIGKNGGITYDVGGNEFALVFGDWIRDKSQANEDALKAILDDQIEGRDDWILKHGHLMLIFPKLKIWYPSSKFILTVRHPLDQMLRWKGFPYTCSELSLPCEENDRYPLEEYAFLHNEALRNTDLIWRLEEVCFDPVYAISKLLMFVGIDDDPNKYLDLINPSVTIGMFHNPIIENLGYSRRIKL